MTERLRTAVSRDNRSGILYLRHRVPLPLVPDFSIGQFYKVSLDTRDLSEARSRFSITNGEFETKRKAFPEALANAGQGSPSGASIGSRQVAGAAPRSWRRYPKWLSKASAPDRPPRNVVA